MMAYPTVAANEKLKSYGRLQSLLSGSTFFNFHQLFGRFLKQSSEFSDLR